jgi:serralysin
LGLAGHDTLDGANGNDTIEGGDDDDTLRGGNGNDTLSGAAGNDSLEGGNGNDSMTGGAGIDTLTGGNGLDTLNGGAGNDVLTGGNDTDTFVFTDLGGSDQITDFKHGPERVDVSGIDAVAGGADNAFSFIGSGAFGGVAGQLRAYNAGGSHYVAGDVNGDSVADFTIQTNVLLVSSDFIL